MKILLVKPDGEKIRIEADYWEFSQNKFVNEDVVLVFYRSEQDTMKEGKDSRIVKPSHKGIISQEKFTEDLNHVIGKDVVDNERKEKGVVLDDSIKNGTQFTITTVERELEKGREDIIVSLKEMVEEERKLIESNCKINLIQPPLIKLKGDKFSIEEVVLIEKQ